MKRYRVFSLDFDARVHSLTIDIRDDWEERVKESWRESKRQVELGLIEEFGAHRQIAKRQDFIDLGAKPLSIVAFHNKFFEHVRVAFICGAYYPALTAACSLGERILNYLVHVLRDEFKATPEYKEVFRKESFDNWDLPIRVLDSWNVLLPSVSNLFRALKVMRHKAIHFRPEVDHNDRTLALDAINCVRDIIANQFAAFGSAPWFLPVPGEMYIKKEWECHPFIRKIYLPNCLLVGPFHTVEAIIPQWKIRDDFAYDNREISDAEFVELRTMPKKYVAKTEVCTG